MATIDNLTQRIENRKAEIAVIGLGYVGLPLLIRFAEAGFAVTGFDVDPEKISLLGKGRSYIKHIPSETIRNILPSASFTSDMSRLKDADAILVCVPTPLNNYQQPDLTYLFNSADDIYSSLRKGQVVSLESTTYPGTTREIFLQKFSEKKLKVGEDYFLVYSPEREDPGNPGYNTMNIPKVVGGVTAGCLRTGVSLYSSVITKVVPVSSPDVAEATKLLENIYRSVNIALVNELKVVFTKMGIDIWEVIEASKTKPFGFHAFYPGPGLGGHCIPIDPFYLTWKAKEYDFYTRFIELSGEINTSMPSYVVDRCIEALNNKGKPVKGANILLVGFAYKKDVDDVRESPAFKIMKLLLSRNAKVAYYDPHVKEVSKSRHLDYPVRSISFSEKELKIYDAAIIVTDHSCVDYKKLLKVLPLIVDARNVYKKNHAKVIKA